MLAALWQRNQPLMLDRINQLRDAGRSLTAGTLTETQRAEAASTAHKMCGTLGTFGYPRGTELARELEMLLEANTEDAEAVLARAEELHTLLLPSLQQD